MEWILLLIIVALLLFGAKKIPEFAQNLGKAKAEFQRGQMMVQQEIRQENQKNDTKQKDDKESIIKAALALGIDPKGKTDEQLKSEIAKKVNN